MFFVVVVIVVVVNVVVNVVVVVVVVSGGGGVRGGGGVGYFSLFIDEGAFANHTLSLNRNKLSMHNIKRG